MALVKQGRIVDDPWTKVSEGVTPPAAGAILVPYALWERQRESLLTRNGPIGIALAGDHPPALIEADLARFELIALEFPTFKDGRAYSQARLLRERYGFTGELRATGDVLRDQFLFLHRCGFDAFEVTATGGAADWEAALSEISVAYQPGTDDRTPASVLRQSQPAA
ncbi:MAG: DUF934 domain-containing protein [Alphaproteobacteria bacterium]|nr:DUF934 domain-containing protein [Alphaproteobacteria bacterium]